MDEPIGIVQCIEIHAGNLEDDRSVQQHVSWCEKAK